MQIKCMLSNSQSLSVAKKSPFPDSYFLCFSMLIAQVLIVPVSNLRSLSLLSSSPPVLAGSYKVLLSYDGHYLNPFVPSSPLMIPAVTAQALPPPGPGPGRWPDSSDTPRPSTHGIVCHVSLEDHIHQRQVAR